MTKELDLDTYLIITNYKFVICLFNKKNFKSIYNQEFTFKGWEKCNCTENHVIEKFIGK